MNVLFLSTENPFPPDHGHHIRALHVLQDLCRHHCVYFIGFTSRLDTPQTLESLRKLCPRSELFSPSHRMGRLRWIWIVIQSIFLLRPFPVHRYFRGTVSRRIHHLIKSVPIDVVHVDIVHLGIYRHAIGSCPAVITHHNVEYTRLQRWMWVERRLLIKVLLAWQTTLMRRFERKICKTFQQGIVVSEPDRRELSRFNPHRTYYVVPNGVDSREFSPKSPGDTNDRALVWVGGMRGAYNRDAVLFFIREIWPRVRDIISLPAIFVGTSPPPRLVKESSRDPRIRLTGYVPDVRPYMTHNRIFIAPLQSGSGTKLKVLNAMSMQMPILTTSIGAEGIELENGVNALIADDAESFANNIKRLEQNPSMATRLGEAARETIKEKYDWECIFQTTQSLYPSLAHGPVQTREPYRYS